MRTTLMKILLIAAVAPTMTLTQEPPTRPKPSERPSPPTTPKPSERPSLLVSPKIDFDFHYDYDVKPLLEDLKFNTHLEDMKFTLDKMHWDAAEMAANIKLQVEPSLKIAMEGLKEMNFQGSPQRELEKAQRE